MKTQRISSSRKGFTLMELMVAMAITTIIVTVLVSITSIALDTWNRSRAELRASRQAKSMIDTMAHDFESMVTRKGNTNEWLAATSDDVANLGENVKSTNATKLVFFTAATDRYDGNAGVENKDLGGDVSCVAYQLEYKNPIDPTDKTNFRTFVVSRLLKNPDETFNNLLGKTDSTKEGTGGLDTVFDAAYGAEITKPANFVCENIFQFAVSFRVQYTDTTTDPSTIRNVAVTVGKQSSDQMGQNFRIQGTGIKTDSTNGSALTAGRVTAVEISATVLSDFGVEALKNRQDLVKDPTKLSKFISQNSFEYTKVVQIPSM